MTKKATRLFDQAYNQYNKYVYTICFRFVNNTEEALDLTQEVMIKLYKNIQIFKNITGMKPWIRTVTVNTCLSHKRTEQNRPLVHENNEIPITEMVKTNETPENQVLFDYTKERALTIINSMEGNIKMAMILRHYDDLSYREIAVSMGVPEGTVKTYIFKGRKILRDRLKKEGLMEVIQ